MALEYTEAISILETALEKHEKKGEVLEALGARLKKLNTENQGLRTRATAAEDFRSGIATALGLADADATVESVQAKLSALQKSGKGDGKGGQGSGLSEEAQATISKLQAQLDTLTKEREQTQAQTAASEKVGAIQKKLREVGFFEDFSNLAAKEAASQFKKDTQGEFVTADGKTLGDWVEGFKAGKERYIESKSGSPGSGSQGPGASGPGPVDRSKASVSDLLQEVISEANK